jgi:hypothetical protein
MPTMRFRGHDGKPLDYDELDACRVRAGNAVPQGRAITGECG